MSMMDVCGPIFCPECKPRFNRRNIQIGVQLECSASNYSGTGSDIANCPECGKGFQISYTVDKIISIPSWDIDLKAVAEAEQQARENQLARKREELAKLEKEVATLKKT